MEGHIPRISEALYVGLCDMIGTPTQVKIRRDVWDTEEMIRNLAEKHNIGKMIMSGSFREGFRMQTSDIDSMVWCLNDIVIWDLSQIPPYHPAHTLILMEIHNTLPGFAKLQLLTPPTNNRALTKSCVIVNEQLYISSSLYREVITDDIKLSPLREPVTIHGPCANRFLNGMEHDHACCFSCQHWPPPAYQWIDRCHRQGWPTPEVLKDIISGGCHLMAIGSGRSTSPQPYDTEWRMSFSQAEYKLVSFMNHTQFLCYGLLKIFLKEVLNADTEHPLLCSYFMKTTLFWKIQKSTIHTWCPQNILNCVWICFKHLIQCVYMGEFPNFFIPQNNMFMNKIHGAAQRQLFLQLLNLYNMGFACLLLSPSLYHILSKNNIIFNSRSRVSTDENATLSDGEFDSEFIAEFLDAFHFTDVHVSRMNLDGVSEAKDFVDRHLRSSSHSQFQNVFLQLLRNRLVIRMAFSLDKPKEINMHDRSLDMLISASECGFLSNTLYVALYLYNKGRYAEALYYADITKQNLNPLYAFDVDKDNVTEVNREMNIGVVGGQSLLDKARKAMPKAIIIEQTTCIDEIKLELHVNKQNVAYGIISAPCLVMTHMLLFLCHHHLGNRLRSRQSLNDLHTMLKYDRVPYTDYINRDMSLQMLGICKQIDGDITGALSCYQESLKHTSLNGIYTASYVRIQNIFKHIHNS